MTTILKSKPFVIDGHDYKITMLGAVQGRKLWLKLLNVLAAPLAALAQAPQLDEQAGAAALSAAIKALDEGTLEEMYALFGARCEVRVGERSPLLEEAIFDMHFAGRYMAMTKWLWECISFNFTADFLGDTSLGNLHAMFQKAVKKTVATRESPSTLTGTSGDSSPTSEPQ